MLPPRDATWHRASDAVPPGALKLHADTACVVTACVVRRYFAQRKRRQIKTPRESTSQGTLPRRMVLRTEHLFDDFLATEFSPGSQFPWTCVSPEAASGFFGGLSSLGFSYRW